MLSIYLIRVVYPDIRVFYFTGLNLLKYEQRRNIYMLIRFLEMNDEDLNLLWRWILGWEWNFIQNKKIMGINSFELLYISYIIWCEPKPRSPSKLRLCQSLKICSLIQKDLWSKFLWHLVVLNPNLLGSMAHNLN